MLRLTPPHTARFPLPPPQSILVRVGGGWQTLDEFIETHQHSASKTLQDAAKAALVNSAERAKAMDNAEAGEAMLAATAEIGGATSSSASSASGTSSTSTTRTTRTVTRTVKSSTTKSSSSPSS